MCPVVQSFCPPFANICPGVGRVDVTTDKKGRRMLGVRECGCVWSDTRGLNLVSLQSGLVPGEPPVFGALSCEMGLILPSFT